MSDTIVAFDLDDTLFCEADFLHSAYRHIAKRLSDKYSSLYYHECLDIMMSANNAFDALFEHFNQLGISVEEDITWCVNTYRTHYPEISLYNDAENTLIKLQQSGIVLALITDGRINTQGNKISALGLDKFIANNNIIISEAIGFNKNQPQPFTMLMEQNPDTKKFHYIGDNTSKDFYWPNKLGWTTICLRDKGRNIHQQDFNCPTDYLPKHVINNLSEITNLILQ